jgi:hypothetical protein
MYVMYVRMYVCVYVCTYVCNVCMCVYRYLRAHVCMCVFTFMFVCARARASVDALNLSMSVDILQKKTTDSFAAFAT